VNFATAAESLAGNDGLQTKPWVHFSPRCISEALFTVPNASAAEVKQAAVVALNAGPEWRCKPMAARCDLLAQVASRLESAAGDLARQMAMEIGKPIRHAQEEIHRAAANIRDVIRRAAGLAASRREAAGLVRRQPLGVIGIITAWNNPVAIPLGKIAPALAYGNTVVWKPAPAGTQIARSLMKLLIAAGLPDGTVQLVTGGHTTAQLVAAEEHVHAVTLTGALAAGHALQEICARRVVPLQAELSGNNAAIVWDDADFVTAAEQVAWGAFAFGGQRCTANRRVIVPEARADEFFRALETATARLTWGDPLESTTEIGPLIHTAKRDELTDLVKAG
jgi:acyl-CoA reductase-like NAD-dependent aldehyde dehydrogenase